MIQRPLFWHQGLFLQPQHFQLLDRSIQSHLTPYNSYAAPSFWGVADLEINKAALANRIFDVRKGVFLFSDGTYIEYPGNTLLNARSFDESWAGKINIYVGIKKWNDSGENVTIEDDAEKIAKVTSRFAASENPHEVHDLHAGGPAGRVKIMNHVLKILWESELEQAGDYVTIQIAQLTKSGADVRLSEDYIPPSLNLFESGSLLKLLTEVRDQITSRSMLLEGYKKKRGIHSAEFGSRDMAYILALRTLSRYVPLFHHFIETRQVHPWTVYAALRQLIGELSVFSERVNVLGELGGGNKIVLPYDHRDLWGCFSAAQDLVSNLLDELTAGADYTIRLNFDSLYYSADLKPAIFEGRNRFYLAVRTEEDVNSVLQAIKTVVKVGSKEELRVIVGRALPGITMEQQLQLPKELPYRSGTTYFLLDHNNEQWESVEKNRNIALYWNNAPGDVEIELMVVGRS